MTETKTSTARGRIAGWGKERAGSPFASGQAGAGRSEGQVFAGERRGGIILGGVCYTLTTASNGSTMIWGLPTNTRGISAVMPPSDLEGDAMQTPEPIFYDLAPLRGDGASDDHARAHLVLRLRSYSDAIALFHESPRVSWALHLRDGAAEAGNPDD